MDVGLIGNCSVAALVDRRGAINWFCLPRLDGDPVFHALLGHGPGAQEDGAFSIELDGFATSEQTYEPNTAVLKTVLRGASGAVEITDFCPRFEARGRSFRPQMIIRRIEPLEGWPRVRFRVRPRFDWARTGPDITRGSNHVRFLGGGQVLRMTTDAPIDHVLDEQLINLDRPLSFVLGPDESLAESPGEIGQTFLEETCRYWRRWVRRLAEIGRAHV